MRIIPVIIALVIAGTSRAELNRSAIAEAVGVDASTTAKGVVRVTWGRTDVNVTVDRVPLEPFAGLTSWAAFKETEPGTMVMGDIVVFQDEVNPAIDAAFAHGLEVTALHNHFLYDDPPVYFMHIAGTGDAQSLARGVRATWDAARAVRAESPKPSRSFPGPAPSPSTLSAEPLADILGVEPDVKDGMVKFSVGRDGVMRNTSFGRSMGLSTWAAFTGNDDLAVVGGDFAMTAPEVQPVLHALRAADINIVALHNHMIGERPAYYFVHFWGKGAPADLARGLKSAIEAQQTAAGTRRQ